MPTIAAIDAGSNAIRLVIANVKNGGEYQIVYSVRAPVRLGQDVFTKGTISADTIDRMLQTFIDFKQHLQEHRVTHVKAVGTSALREATNGATVLKAVAKATGIEISIIDGGEEARLIHLAVKETVNLKGRVALLVDIGGGSVEVVLAGGSIEVIGELRKEIFAKNSSQKVTAEELKALVKKFRAMTFEQRIQDLRLRPDRADVIVPAAIVLLKIVQQAGVVEVVIPGIGLKDSVLLDIISELRDQERHLYREQVLESARRFGKKYCVDEKHANTVAKLAMQIFDQTKRFHELDAEARLILEVAALLHDVGHYVNVANHHKHTFYLIQSSSLIGLTQLQMDLVANVARYHRKSVPKLQHKPYEDLAPKLRLTISKLAAILRLADALDHEHASTVDSVEVEYKRPRFMFRLKGKGDMLLEKWALVNKRDLFESVFNANVVVEDLAS